MQGLLQNEKKQINDRKKFTNINFNLYHIKKCACRNSLYVFGMKNKCVLIINKCITMNRLFNKAIGCQYSNIFMVFDIDV